MRLIFIMSHEAKVVILRQDTLANVACSVVRYYSRGPRHLTAQAYLARFSIAFDLYNSAHFFYYNIKTNMISESTKFLLLLSLRAQFILNSIEAKVQQ